MVDDTRVNNVVTFDIPLRREDDDGVKDELDRPEQPAGSDVTGSGTTVRAGNITTPTTSNKNRPPAIVAQEEDSDNDDEKDEEQHDVIPGPATPGERMNSSGIKPSNSNVMDQSGNSRSSLGDSTEHYGSAMHSTLASRRDLNMAPDEFAVGCKLLQAAALGNLKTMEEYLKTRPKFINFRDYDRRYVVCFFSFTLLFYVCSTTLCSIFFLSYQALSLTIVLLFGFRRTALHVAASEGHLEACQYLVQKGAKINRRYVDLLMIAFYFFNDPPPLSGPCLMIAFYCFLHDFLIIAFFLFHTR